MVLFVLKTAQIIIKEWFDLGKEKLLAASIQAKSGRLYAVIQAKENGKTKPFWRALGLPEGTNQTKVNKAFREVVGTFEKEWADKLARNGRPSADIPVYDYMSAYLKKVEPNLQKNTTAGYRMMIEGKIKRYFNARRELTVGNLTAKDIEEFYNYLSKLGDSGNTIIHYHAILHRAFKQAFREDRIDANPFDKIDRPKKNKFTGGNYTEEELITLLNIIKSEVIYPAVVLTGCLGLRRSEALGARWSRIDWESKTILLDTKIVEYKKNGKTVYEPVEEMKNKTSRRTLPLPDPVYEMLKEQKEKQAEYRKMFKRSYSKKYTDYVCTDQLGVLLKPSYVTQHFSDLLKRHGLRKIRFHDLRHTFASILINRDVPLLNVSAFLGHSDISTTANIYAHLDKSKKQQSADIISNIFDKHSA